ncbi:MAG: four helix bundle protein [Anaerolineae bacterium]|nr:four helix bundle protein [Anaerolineae bacterium]
MTSEKGLDSLQVWQRSVEFAIQIYKQILPLLPPEEKWALANQLRRASQSISANIAEGYGRYYYQEAVRFCYIARGSLEETYSHLVLANKLEYLPDIVLNDFRDEIQELHRMLNGYISFLKRSKRGEGEPGSIEILREGPRAYESITDLETPDP